MHSNSTVVSELIEVVWRQRDLGALGRFWSADCVNHAAGSNDNRGLDALLRYHQEQFKAFADLASSTIEVLQQVAEEDRVATHMLMTATHSPTGRRVTMAAIRLDRLRDDKVVEHWSIADQAGLLAQLQP
jgi:predicted ester cyclase